MLSDQEILRQLHNAAIESLDNIQLINSFPVFAITEVINSSYEKREFLAATGSVCLSDSLMKMFMDTIPPNKRSSHTLTVLRQIAGAKVVLIKIMQMLFPDGITGLANDRAFLAILGALFKAGSRVFAVECIKIIFCRLVQAVQNQVEALVLHGHIVIASVRPHSDSRTSVFLNGIRSASERSRPQKNYYDTRRDVSKTMRTINDGGRDLRVWTPPPRHVNKKLRTDANEASFELYSKRFRTQIDKFVSSPSLLSGTSPSSSSAASLSPSSGASPSSSPASSISLQLNYTRPTLNSDSKGVDKPVGDFSGYSQGSRGASEPIDQPRQAIDYSFPLVPASYPLSTSARSLFHDQTQLTLDSAKRSDPGTASNSFSTITPGPFGGPQGNENVSLSSY